MKASIVILALVLAACGGGNKEPQAEATPAPKPEATELLQMPPAGDPLWAIPPDRSPLWQLVGPDPNAKSV
jgi:hypothetical protein